jgi:hypothetical protein
MIQSKIFVAVHTPKKMQHQSIAQPLRRRIPQFQIVICAPCYIHLPNQHRTSHTHGNSNDGQVDASEIETPDADVLASEDVAPEEAGERGAERSAESAVVDAQGHAVYSGPECALGDWRVVFAVDLFPGLDDTREEDRGTDVCAGKLDARHVSNTKDTESPSKANYFTYIA